MVKIWKDFHFLRTSLLICFSLSLLFAFYIYVREVGFNLNKKFFLLLIVLLVPIYFVISFLRTKLSFVTKNGVRIGNAPNDSYEKVILKQKPAFLYWNDIKEIKIIGREVPRPGYKWLVDFLIIKSKDNKKYECFIANPKGFVKAIKDLKKSHLFAKDSKYLDLISKK